MSSKGKAGSLIDFRIAVENHEVLDSSILALNKDWEEGKINWYSPKKDKTSPIEDTWCKEFKDKSFWDGKLDKDSNSFWDEMGNPNINRNSWPKGGPSWDGIAVLTDKNGEKILLLFEAKAHKGELSSSCSATDIGSIEVISKHLNETKKSLGLDENVDCMKRYYQFANRLAFLDDLQKDNKIKVALICVYFANDPYWNTKKDHTDKGQWEKAIETEKDYFGITEDKLIMKHIYDLKIDLNSDQYKDILGKINDKLKENNITCGTDVES